MILFSLILRESKFTGSQRDCLRLTGYTVASFQIGGCLPQQTGNYQKQKTQSARVVRVHTFLDGTTVVSNFGDGDSGAGAIHTNAGNFLGDTTGEGCQILGAPPRDVSLCAQVGILLE